MFSSANTTSNLILELFKVHYRSYFLRHVLTKIDECACASEVVKSINVLVAIRWVAMAWSLVQEETIRKCFRRAGVLDSDLTVVARDEQDPFLATDECATLEDLISITMSGHEACPVEEYITGEGSLPVCNGLDDSNWESSFFAQLVQEEPEEEDDDQGEQILTLPTIKTYKDANMYVEEVQQFLEQEGHVEEAFKLGSIIDKVFRSVRTKQTTLDSWLN